jgi:hypothetical protein
MNAKERHEEATWLGQKATPRDEQRRSAWGSLEMSLQTIDGLCPEPKCVRKAQHAGGCWPTKET